MIVPTDVKADDFVYGGDDADRKMKAIEDVSARAVPVTTDLDGTVKGSGAG